jgi:hypothetical protein
VDKRLAREILKMEDQLRQASLNCDATSLDRLLADYFASAYEGSEKGTSKRATLALSEQAHFPITRLKTKKRSMFDQKLL